jgi:DNA-directed RNA polymerase subunit beta'
VVIREEDCGDKEGKTISLAYVTGFNTGLANLIKGRILLKEVADKAGKVLFKKGHLLTLADARVIDAAQVPEVTVRTPLTCKTIKGLCQKCYGQDLGRGHLVAIGEPIGVVAAQAIGEPGTQLTMRTKHTGGISTGGIDIVGGLPRVEEIFERRQPKNPAVIAEVDGEVSEITNDGKEYTMTILVDLESRKKNAKTNTAQYSAPMARTLFVKAGDQVKKGQVLTDGPVELTALFKLAGRNATEDYVMREINAIYELQGVNIARKHIEIIVRQMFSRRRIKTAGDTKFAVGELVEEIEFFEDNQRVANDGAEVATGDQVLLGISDVALSTSSFLAAVSFQHTNRVLVDMAIKGGLDKLRGLKENVIIGRLIPAGTGLKSSDDNSAQEPILESED